MIHQWLQIVFAVVVVVLAVYLVLLLVQLRKTAVAMEVLAMSAARDIARVAEDVHQIKLQVDDISMLAKDALALPASLSQMFKGVASSIPSMFGSQKPRSGLLDLLIAGIQAAVALFRR